MSPRKRPWTTQRVRDLGLTTDVETAGEILGIGRTTAYQLVKRGEFPVRVIVIGRARRVPVLELLRLLGADEDGRPVAPA